MNWLYLVPMKTTNEMKQKYPIKPKREKAPTRAQIERWLALKGYPAFIIEEMLSA